MKQIKFRSWDGKSMQYGGFSIHATGFIQPTELCGGIKNVMQFTGAQDFYKSDIFEGDIVFLDSKMMIGVIETDGISWRIKFEKDLDWLCDYYEDLHVVGNIYENAELLK